jgi:hypothetical protein
MAEAWFGHLPEISGVNHGFSSLIWLFVIEMSAH